MASGTATPGDQFIKELNQLRVEARKVVPYKAHDSRSWEQKAAGKRKSLRGGTFNHSFAGEQYLASSVKAVRRMMLTKLMDEGGQTNFGGPVPTHPELSRMEARAYGVTDAEIAQLEREDLAPEELVHRGWRIATCRDSHFCVGIGTSYVGEGDTRLHAEERRADAELVRQEFIDHGVKDLDSALANMIEHTAADEDHALFNENVMRQYCNTPELQDDMRRAFVLRIHSRFGLS